MKTLQWIFKQERGSAILLALGFLVFLLAMGGIAIDVTYQMTAAGERSGAWKRRRSPAPGSSDRRHCLSGGESRPSSSRAESVPQRLGNLINLDPNITNAPNGKIVLGTWDGAAFNAFARRNCVNGVRCQWNTTVQTSILRVSASRRSSRRRRSRSESPRQPPADRLHVPDRPQLVLLRGQHLARMRCDGGVHLEQRSIGGRRQHRRLGQHAADVRHLRWRGLREQRQHAEHFRRDRRRRQRHLPDQHASSRDVASRVDQRHHNRRLQQPPDPEFHPEVQCLGNALPSRRPTAPIPTVGKGWEVYVPVIQTAGGCPPGRRQRPPAGRRLHPLRDHPGPQQQRPVRRGEPLARQSLGRRSVTRPRTGRRPT